KRISAELRRRQIADVGETWIEALFDRFGTARPSLPPEAGPRYELSQPNELWHIDIKGPFFLQLREHRYLKTGLLGLVDDHSRYVLGLRIQTSSQLAPILIWLRDCIELCGQPLVVMSDNGSPFVVWMPGVLTAFGKTLQEMAIRHIRTQINSPWTNGKIERFWKLLQAEVLDRQVFRSLEEAEEALSRFAAYYNYHRLSGAIGWLTPGERFDGTPFTDRGFENIPLSNTFKIGWPNSCARPRERSLKNPRELQLGSDRCPERGVLGKRPYHRHLDRRSQHLVGDPTNIGRGDGVDARHLLLDRLARPDHQLL